MGWFEYAYPLDRDVMAWVAASGGGISGEMVRDMTLDYVNVNPRPDAISVLQRLAEWFEDYSTIHSHSGVRMRSPREFIADQSATQTACPV
ncbi:hypothetical protein GCM10011320_29450 [Neoroseomonas lacus]|uniref:Integrase catalytic domain-containing protein n=2 Tax=Neoroseomonas lacus TaxID=287609 RepID=A0A917NS40_9PROT|nr:hypothetical protein GCM10011320_29450 [Neoroseomonas lacus]